MAQTAHVSLVALALIVGGVTSVAADTLPEASWLFIQEAESATYANGELVLSGVAPDLSAFTDRPHRIATRISLPGFAALWSAGRNSFGEDNPNAGVTMQSPNGMVTAIVTLDLPRVDGETLVYPVELLGGVLPAAGSDVSLFIDAFPTSVNDQITDAVTETNVKVLGDAPAMAMGSLYQATAQALADAAHNATSAQQNANTILQATTTQGVSLLYGVDTASSAVGISKILADN